MPIKFAYDAHVKLNPAEKRRHDELDKRYFGEGRELSEREMDEYRKLHVRDVEGK